jgi:hypothetical protein
MPKSHAMFSISHKLLLWITCFSVWTLSAPAQHDALQAQLQNTYLHPLFWDSITQQHEVYGEHPSLNWKNRRLQVILAPSQEIFFHFPPRSMLRVMPIRSSLSNADIDVSTSNGSGLFVTLPLLFQGNDHSLFYHPNTELPGILRIAHSERGSQPLTVALFSSRQESIRAPEPYRLPATAPLPVSRISRANQFGEEEYYWLQANTSTPFTIHEAIRLQCELYMPFDSSMTLPFQSCQLLIACNNHPSLSFSFSSFANTKEDWIVDGTPLVLSHKQRAWLNPPHGTQDIMVTPSRDIYLRIRGMKENNYLFPQTNRPHPAPQTILDTWREQQQRPMETGWENAMRHFFQKPIQLSMLAEVNAWVKKLQIDNLHRDSQLVAAALLHKAAADNPHQPELRNEAIDFFEKNTFHRDLAPQPHTQPFTITHACFIPASLRQDTEDTDFTVLFEPHLQSWVQTMPLGRFIQMEGTKNNPLVYPLPPRQLPTTFRVAIQHRPHQEFSGDIFLQLDSNPPTRLSVIPAPLAAEHVSLSPMAESLALLEHTQPSFAGTTLSAGFTRTKTPAPLSRVHYTHFELPSTITTIKVWSETDNATRPFLSLAYRAANNASLSEEHFLEIMRQITPNVFTDILTANTTPPAPSFTTETEQELFQHCLPMLRYIHINAQALHHAIPPSRKEPLALLSAREIQTLKERALQNQSEDKYLNALQDWNSLVHQGTRQTRPEALWHRAYALEKLGEYYLAKQQYLGIWLHEPQTPFSNHAFHRLVALYETTHDWQNLIRLRSAALTRNPSAHNFVAFAETAYQNNKIEFALLASLAGFKQDPDAVNINTLLAAALHNQWLNVFNFVEENSRIRVPEEWLAQRDIARGDVPQAKQTLLTAKSQAAAQLHAAIERNVSIASAIASPDPETRSQGIQQWQENQNTLPHATRWENSDHTIAQAPGSAMLHIIDQGLFAHGFIATPTSPALFEVEGPAIVKFEMRPIFTNAGMQTIDDWIMIESEDKIIPTPIINTPPVSNIALVANPDQKVGYQVDNEIKLDAGRHRLLVYPVNYPIFVQSNRKVPEIALGIIPPLTPQTIQAAAMGQYVPRTPQTIDSRLDEPHVRLHTLDKQVSVFHPQYRQLKAHETHVSHLDESRPVDSFQKRGPAYITQKMLSIPVEDYLQQVNATEETALARMAELLWITKTYPEHQLFASIQAERLMQQYPHLPQLQSLHFQLTKDLQWQRIPSVSHSAGLRYMEEKGWNPESKTLQIRQHLLPPLQPAQEVLFGEKIVGLYIQNFTPARIQYRFALQVPDFIQPTPITIACQINEGEIQNIVVTEDNPENSVTLHIPTGQHTVRCWIQEPIINHFVFVEHADLDREHEHEHLRQALEPTVQRYYQVGLRDDPITLNITGPAWLRIDERQGNETQSTYQFIASREEQITVYPSHSAPEAMFRFFTRSLRPASSPSAIIVQEDSPTPLPGPLWRQDQMPKAAADTDQINHPLAAYWDGTWTAEIKAQRRRIIEEDVLQQQGFDDFLQGGLSHRYYYETGNAYFHTNLLSRYRSPGGPTLAVLEDIRYAPDNVPWTLHFGGNLFVQKLDDQSLPHRDGLEFSSYLRTAVSTTYHLSNEWRSTPAITLFARHLSLDQDSASGLKYLDQDIYTRYKQEHQHGLRISNTLTFNPWQDTEWWLLGGVALNEINQWPQLDHLYFKTGWKQLFRHSQVNLTWHAYQFLNDADRLSSVTRNAVSLDILHDLWSQPRRHINLGAEIRYDFDHNDFTASLHITWNLGKERMYQDYQPGEIDFVQQRLQLSPVFLKDPQ